MPFVGDRTCSGMRGTGTRVSYETCAATARYRVHVGTYADSYFLCQKHMRRVVEYHTRKGLGDMTMTIRHYTCYGEREPLVATIRARRDMGRGC